MSFKATMRNAPLAKWINEVLTDTCLPPLSLLNETVCDTPAEASSIACAKATLTRSICRRCVTISKPVSVAAALL